MQRRQALSSLQVAYDNPDYIAGMVFDRVVFGRHPYGRPNEGTPGSIGRISQADLVAFHRTWFVPKNNALLAIVGDLTADEAFAAAEKAFGTWARRDIPVVRPEVPPPSARKIVVIDRPGSAQTEIACGTCDRAAHASGLPAVRPGHSYPWWRGRESAVRACPVDRGLTYGASADFHAYKMSGGVVQTDTRTAVTGEALKLLVDEFGRLQRNPVHPAELEGARTSSPGIFLSPSRRRHQSPRRCWRGCSSDRTCRRSTHISIASAA